MNMGLKYIRQNIINDPENTWAKKNGWKPVYAASETAKILIIGQAPGLRAQESCLPWNDPSGDNLREWMGVTRETFYDESKIALVPMDFYFPGSSGKWDLPPRKDFAEKWHPLLLANMPKIELILLIGQYAQAYHLGKERKKTLTETVQCYQEYLPKYLPLVHPSPRNNIWHKKNPWFKEEVVPVLQKRVGKILG